MAAGRVQDADLRERYASQALGQLRECRRVGGLSSPTAVADMLRDEDLKALLPRPEFQQFVNGLPGKKAP
jgi:hypothetical protein